MALNPNRSFGEVTLLLPLYCLVSIHAISTHTAYLSTLQALSCKHRWLSDDLDSRCVQREKTLVSSCLTPTMTGSFFRRGCSPFSHTKVIKTPTKQFCFPWGLLVLLEQLTFLWSYDTKQQGKTGKTSFPCSNYDYVVCYSFSQPNVTNDISSLFCFSGGKSLSIAFCLFSWSQCIMILIYLVGKTEGIRSSQFRKHQEKPQCEKSVYLVPPMVIMSH